MKEIIKRLKSETPTFFKKLGLIGVGLASIGGGLLTITGLPVVITTIATYSLAIGTTIKAISSLAVENKEDLK